MKIFTERINNMLTLHGKQAEKYTAEGKKAIGFIKFNDYTSNLVEGRFFLNSIEHFWDNGRDKIKDDSEGIIRLTNNEKIEYSEILNNKAQTYISSFTVLFEDDFDNEGKIKDTTVNKLLNKSGDAETRDAVIFNLSLMKSFETMRCNTPEFVNCEIRKPRMDAKRIQRFKTNNFLCWREEINFVYPDSDEDYSNAIKSLTTKNLQGGNTKETFQKRNWLEKIENRISIGLKGTYVYYDDKLLNMKKDVILNEINETKEIKVYEKYLEECFARKANEYRDQREYRLIFSEFKEADTKENFIFPKGIELEYLLKSKEWYAKEVKNSEAENLRLEDFKN
ncbi:hypothetical protein [Liquorilactobacillus mali]|uniref:Uncharacterized protein n=2 Tax=Liquorilactobacillus mali TaxID=1618 RepID=A0A0R2E9I7_9LACO|nr:hypothetical protein [Liquorilactobacillus mali]KRN08940.1 hypothetical protein FD00_GL001648 [Liquorilactobacillus mali KCTC 3596 = DSM 20444]